MSFIFQDPYSSLNPRQRAGDIVGAPIRAIHKIVSNKAEYRNNVEHLFRTVRLNTSMMGRFPHEFSGGQRQRIGIARALACNPSFIVCDEPVSALDVSIQAQIINLLEDLKEGLKGLTYLFIFHDLSVVNISDRVVVMYFGHIVEIGRCEDLFENPLHPYSKALLSAVPVPNPSIEAKRKRILLVGEVPSPMHPPQGCPFHPRCNIATPECQQEIPLLRDFSNTHKIACCKV